MYMYIIGASATWLLGDTRAARGLQVELITSMHLNTIPNVYNNASIRNVG